MIRLRELIWIAISGTVRGDGYDAMIVGGDLTLDGNLNVLAIGGYAPQAGDLFDILDFEQANLSGLFNNVNLPALASDLEWDQSNLYTTGELLVSLSTSQASGDFDGDFESDGDGDGSVDGDDFLVWQRNYPYPAAVSSVPEPNSLVLLALGGLMMLRRTKHPLRDKDSSIIAFCLTLSSLDGQGAIVSVPPR